MRQQRMVRMVLKGNDREFKRDSLFSDDRVFRAGVVYDEIRMAAPDESNGRSPTKNRRWSGRC